MKTKPDLMNLFFFFFLFLCSCIDPAAATSHAKVVAYSSSTCASSSTHYTLFDGPISNGCMSLQTNLPVSSTLSIDSQSIIVGCTNNNLLASAYLFYNNPSCITAYNPLVLLNTAYSYYNASFVNTTASEANYTYTLDTRSAYLPTPLERPYVANFTFVNSGVCVSPDYKDSLVPLNYAFKLTCSSTPTLPATTSSAMTNVCSIVLVWIACLLNLNLFLLLQ